MLKENFYFMISMILSNYSFSSIIQDKYTLFLDAIDANNTKMAKQLIKEGLNIHQKDQDGHSFLWLAIHEKNTEIATLLIEKGLDIHEKDKNGHSLLWLAIHEKNTEIATLLIEKGLDIHEKDQDGHSFLWLAVYNYNKKMTKLLIEKGLDIHEKDQNGHSLLWVAIYMMDGEMASLLIKKRINIYEKDKHGHSLFHYSSYLSIKKEAIKSYLTKNISAKKLDDLSSDLSSFWDECQLHIQQITEKIPSFIGLMRLKDQNRSVTAIRGMCRRNETTFNQLKYLSSSETFIDLFGTQLKERVSRCETLNACLTMIPKVKTESSLPIEIWDKILRYLVNKDLQNFRQALED